MCSPVITTTVGTAGQGDIISAPPWAILRYRLPTSGHIEKGHPNGGAQEPAVAVPYDGRRRLQLGCEHCRYRRAETRAVATITATEMNAVTLISMVKEIFTIWHSPFRGLACRDSHAKVAQNAPRSLSKAGGAVLFLFAIVRRGPTIGNQGIGADYDP